MSPIPVTPQNGLISRVADSCIWFGRYLERSESTARELQATLHLALDGELSPRRCWFPMTVIAGEEAAMQKQHGDAAFEDGELVQRYLVWDDDCGVSLRRSISAARENARSIRDVLSSEVWEATNELHLWMTDGSAQLAWDTQRDEFYRRVRQSAQLSLGLLRSTMLHDCVLDFIWLGMLLERIGQTARLLDVHHHVFSLEDRQHPMIETIVWVALLRAFSGLESFIKNMGQVTPDAVAAFLFGEPRFPRSIAYCVRSAYDRLNSLVAAEKGAPGQSALVRLHALDEWVRATSSAPLKATELHVMLTHVVDESAAVFELIGTELLGHVDAPAVAVTPES